MILGSVCYACVNFCRLIEMKKKGVSVWWPTDFDCSTVMSLVVGWSQVVVLLGMCP